MPQDQPDLATAIQAAVPGDVVLLDRGTYDGEVVVPATVSGITIRGVDRNAVVFDGEDSRTNAIYVLGDDVTIENMTAHNFTGNGFYWKGAEGFAGRYLTVYNVGLYGIYAIESTEGRFEHSLVSGAADAAFYIGECDPCASVLTDLTARLSAVGYSGTNASGGVVVKDSLWELNGTGILPNSYDVGIAEPPQAGTTITGNIVTGSGTVDVPVNTPLAGMRGIGIGIAGGLDNVVEDNTVADSGRYGVAVFPTIDQEENVWVPSGNRIAANDVTGSGIADLALAEGSGQGNCFEGNEHETALPELLDGSCAEGVSGSSDVATELVGPPPILAGRQPLEHAPPYTELEPPGPQPTMRVEAAGSDERSLALPLGTAAAVAGAALIGFGLSGRARRSLLVAGVVLLGAGMVGIAVPLFDRAALAPQAVPSPSASPRPPTESSAPSPTTAPPSADLGSAVSSDGRRITVAQVSALDRLPGTQGETHHASPGSAFLVIIARLTDDVGPAELSSEQARIVTPDGQTIIASGAGEEKFCDRCVLGVSSEDEAVLSFVFAIEKGQVDETFSFRYEGFRAIRVSAAGEPSG